MDAESKARFEALHAQHAGAVRTYVHRRIEAQEADDVVADVFVVAWRRLDEVPPDGLPWLLGVARRVLANRRRGVARRAALRSRIAFERPVLIASEHAGRSSSDVLAALSTLSDGDREALLLIAWEDLSPAQAAEVLGLGASTFYARLSRARRRFERAFATQTGQTTTQSHSLTERPTP